MFIFQKRPLSLILCIMLVGFFVFSYFEGIFKYLPAFFIPIIATVPFVIKKLSSKKIIMLLSATAILIGCLASYLYFDLYFKAYDRFDGKVSIDASVLQINQSTSYTSKLTVKSSNVDDQAFSKYKFVMYVPTQEVGSLSVGDKISLSAKIEGFDFGGNFDSRQYYFSDGISGSLEEVENITIIEKGNGTPDSFLSHLREVLRRKTVLLSNTESGNLLSALLTGERNELSGEIKQDFKRIGISHILALSGMHLSILSLAINKLLKLLSVNKKLRSIGIIVFSVVYMAFVGFSVSVVRAGLMLIISSLLSLLSEDNDSINSLTLSVFLICVVTPYAVFDVALWLSAFATLGVIISLNKHDASEIKSPIKKILKYVTDSLLSSVYAISATLLISVLSFGGLSIASPVSTLIFSLLIEFYMYLGSIMIILGLIFAPLSYPFALVLIHSTSIIKALAKFISSPDVTYVSTNYPLMIISIIIFTVLFFILIVIKANRKVVSGILITAFVSIFVIGGALKASEYQRDSLVYSSTDKGDMFIIRSGKSSALINSSQYSKSIAYKAIDFLAENHLYSIDTYVVSHYAYSLEEDFDILLTGVLIKEISLPHPKNEDEMLIYEKLKESTEDFRVKISLHGEGGNISVGNFVVSPIYYHPYGEGSSVNAFSINYKQSTKYLYISSGMMSDNGNYISQSLLEEADALIFGAHGKKYKDIIYMNNVYNRTKTLILAGDGLYLTQNSYKTYIEKGCEIYSHPNTVKLLDVKTTR